MPDVYERALARLDEITEAEMAATPHDAAFIAIIRNASPALLALLRALLMERQRYAYNDWMPSNPKAEAAYTKLIEARAATDAALAAFAGGAHA